MNPDRRYYFNALFDLELGGFSVAPLQRDAAEMTALYIPLLREGETAVVDVGLQGSYPAYLRRFGLAQGAISAVDPGTGIPEVWGWNAAVFNRIGNIAVDAYPPLETVHRVNGRAFCSELGKRHGTGVPGSHYCRSTDEVLSALGSPDCTWPVALKSAFGGSGFGLRVVRDKTDLGSVLPRIEEHCIRHGVVVEPWYHRICDMSTSVEVDRGVRASPVAYQRQWVNRYGAFFGVYCAENDPVIDRWREPLERATVIAAAAVAQTGYFGPVGFDSFVYRTAAGEQRLAPVIEINARRTMGMVAQQMRARIAPGTPVALRVISRKRCALPATQEEWVRRCGMIHYNVESKKGVLLLTPVRAEYSGVWLQPQRSVFFIAGSSEEEILEYDGVLRKLFSRSSC